MKHLYNGILYRNENKQSTTTRKNTDESHKYNIEQKPNIKYYCYNTALFNVYAIQK